jgi:hypothetical protein
MASESIFCHYVFHNFVLRKNVFLVTTPQNLELARVFRVHMSLPSHASSSLMLGLVVLCAVLLGVASCLVMCGVSSYVLFLVWVVPPSLFSDRVLFFLTFPISPLLPLPALPLLSLTVSCFALSCLVLFLLFLLFLLLHLDALFCFSACLACLRVSLRSPTLAPCTLLAYQQKDQTLDRSDERQKGDCERTKGVLIHL